jgi:hypothetical protein
MGNRKIHTEPEAIKLLLRITTKCEADACEILRDDVSFDIYSETDSIRAGNFGDDRNFGRASQEALQ